MTLKLSGNQIQSVKDLTGLKQCSHLRVIELVKNPLCSQAGDYRRKVRDLLPWIDLIDGRDKDGTLVQSDDEEFDALSSGKNSDKS